MKDDVRSLPLAASPGLRYMVQSEIVRGERRLYWVIYRTANMRQWEDVGGSYTTDKRVAERLCEKLQSKCQPVSEGEK